VTGCSLISCNRLRLLRCRQSLAISLRKRTSGEGTTSTALVLGRGLQGATLTRTGRGGEPVKTGRAEQSLTGSISFYGLNWSCRTAHLAGWTTQPCVEKWLDEKRGKRQIKKMSRTAATMRDGWKAEPVKERFRRGEPTPEKAGCRYNTSSNFIPDYIQCIDTQLVTP